MPSPAGYKTFSAGAVLTAGTDVQQHLMDQVVCVFADASARSSAISSPAEGQVSYLKDTNKVYFYDGSAWTEVGGGVEWSGSTANGLATYGSASQVVAESTATYDGTTLALTAAGGGVKLDDLDSSNANTLDFYEEGTWTAAVTASTSGTITVSTSNDTGAYIRIGRLVFITGTIELSSVSSPSGTLRMGGLPFAIANDLTEQADRGNITTTVLNMATAVSRGIYTHAAAGTTFYDINDGNGGTSIGATLAGSIDAGSSFVIGGFYYAAA